MFGRGVAIYVSRRDGRIGNPAYEGIFAALGLTSELLTRDRRAILAEGLASATLADDNASLPGNRLISDAKRKWPFRSGDPPPVGCEPAAEFAGIPLNSGHCVF